jgi:uncharacterized membrane protein
MLFCGPTPLVQQLALLAPLFSRVAIAKLYASLATVVETSEVTVFALTWKQQQKEQNIKIFKHRM